MVARLSRLFTSRSRPLAVLVLFICLLATFWGWLQAREQVEQEARSYFDSRVAQVLNAIQLRMRTYEQVLRGGVAFLYASQTVTRSEWRTYVDTLELQTGFPGILGVGFTVYVRPDEVPALEQRLRAEGHPEFRIWPEGARDVYTAIVYLEPFNWRNRRAIGFDMYSEPTRREAMIAARDTGRTMVTGKVQLVQETTEGVQAGFLMYLPVYRGGVAPATLEERRERLLGFVYSPFRMDDLMAGLLGRSVPDLALRIYDGLSMTPDSLMYEGGYQPGLPAFEHVETIQINGHSWTIYLASQPALEQAMLERSRPLIVLLAGLGLSLLLFALLWMIAGTETRAMAMAQTMAAAFRRSEAKFASLVQAAQDGIVIADSAGRIVAWNDGAARMFGYQEQAVLGQPWAMILPERLRPEFDRWQQAAMAGDRRLLGRAVEIYGRRQNGEEFPIEVTLSRWGAGGEMSLSAIIRDTSERKRVEQALRLSEARFRTTFENAAIGIMLTDHQNRIVEANPALERMLGYDVGELRGMEQSGLVHPDDRAATEVLAEALVERRQPFVKQQKRYLRKDGTAMWGSVTVSLIRDDDGKPLNLLRMIEDVTELRAAEEALNRAYHELEQRVEARTWELRAQASELARSNAELEQFAYVASHDLQEPLRSVSSFAQLLERRYKDQLGEEGLRFVRFIVSGTDRMRHLITDLLAYSRVGAREKPLTAVDTGEVLATVLSDLDANIGERRAEVSHGPLPTVWGDAGDLQQLFQNLIANALKFNRSSPPRVEISAEDHGGEWLFTVRDNGIGIDPDFMPRLFTIFQRGHGREEYAGTGIGLAICKKVVERCHGRIWAESEPGRGTAFFFTLPKPPADSAADTEALRRGAGRG